MSDEGYRWAHATGGLLIVVGIVGFLLAVEQPSSGWLLLLCSGLALLGSALVSLRFIYGGRP